MKKMFLAIIIITTIMMCGYNLYKSTFVVNIFPTSSIDFNSIEEIFDEDKNLLQATVDYLKTLKELENLKYDDIYFDRTMKSGWISNAGAPIKIENDEIAKVFNSIMKRKYHKVSKNETAISFMRWSRGAAEKGIVYSIDGQKISDDEKGVEFLIKLEPLKEQNWYYYEADYNRWRHYEY